MDPKNGKNERDALQVQLRYHRRMGAGLLALAGVLAAGWLWAEINSKVALIPAEVRRPYEIGAHYADRDYLADMSEYVLSKILTTSPEVVDHNNQVILKMTDPDGYGAFKADLDAAALRIKRDRIATVWIPGKEEIFEGAKRVKVSGRLKTYIADVLTSNHSKEYIVDFTINTAGRLYVRTAKEVVKPDPVRPSGQ
jgi:conjugal transfer pilus assembly protein TraE